jgi:hypothetical protein
MNDEINPETDNGQSLLMPGLSVIEQQERASIDILVATAKKYPRDLLRVKRSMEAMATLDAETAESCNYTLKRVDKKTGEEILIQGPSVRMAEIAVASYGNIRAGSRVVANDGKIIVGQAFCHDLENNTFIAWETQRRITDKSGRTYGEDLQVLTGNAASAIAFRNAVFKVIPGAIVKPVAEKALQVAVGDIKTLEERRQRALRKFATLGIDSARILSFLGKKNVLEIDIVDVENLFGIFTAIKEGTVSIEEQFPKEPKVVEPNFKGQAAQPVAEPPPLKPQAPPSPPPTSPKPKAQPRDSAQQELIKRGPGRPRKSMTEDLLGPSADIQAQQEKKTEPKSTAETEVTARLASANIPLELFKSLMARNGYLAADGSIEEEGYAVSLQQWSDVLDHLRQSQNEQTLPFA